MLGFGPNEPPGVAGRHARRRVALAVLLCGCLRPSLPGGIPGKSLTDVITVMLDDAWWLQVRRDGNHAIGYGALPARMAVATDALDIGRLHDMVARNTVTDATTPLTPGECRYTATFSGPGADAGRVHALRPDVCDELADMFRTAWSNLDPTTEAAATEVIERAWRDAPFLRTPSRKP